MGTEPALNALIYSANEGVVGKMRQSVIGVNVADRTGLIQNLGKLSRFSCWMTSPDINAIQSGCIKWLPGRGMLNP